MLEKQINFYYLLRLNYLLQEKNLLEFPKNIKKICQTGNIIRKEILNFKRNLDNIENDKRIKILILGGSQAAKIFAEKLPKIFEKCHIYGVPLKIFQQCLPEQKPILSNLYNKINLECEIFNFSDDIVNYFSKANLVITRAGSSMLAELVNVKNSFHLGTFTFVSR